MSDWWNPLSWGARDPEKYDPNTEQGKAARTFGGPNHGYDIGSTSAQGTQLDTGHYDQIRGRQLGLADTLTAAMRGEGPSAAGMAAQAQRDAALSNAAALTAGSRGRSAVGSMILANGAAAQGTQQAAQNESIGRAQEMAQARGEYGGLLSGIAGQDVGIAGENAQLGQNANQFNASLGQQRNLANQAAELGISTEELRARQQQEGYSVGNLDPGSKGYIEDLAAPIAYGAAKALMADGGVVMPSMPGSSNYQQLMSPGQRRVPLSKGETDTGGRLVSALAAALGGYLQAKTETDKKRDSDRAKADADKKAAAQVAQDKAEADALRRQMAQDSWWATHPPGSQAGNYQDPMGRDYFRDPDVPRYAKGGMVGGPATVLVGEAGPEAIVPLRGGEGRVVTRPTLATLGRGGPDAVVPLSKPLAGTLAKALRRG